jgi:nitrate/TMAO reductase-like tetraheme cytochrome c subunit
MPLTAYHGGKPRHRSRLRKKKINPLWIIIPAAVVALGLVAAGGGYAFASTQEENNNFCASCHTQPESTYYQRFLSATPVDLASDHAKKNAAKCIDCHSGIGFDGRLSAIMMGARNAFHWYTHTAVQPAPLTVPISDDNCLKCHQDVTGQTTFNNHFHGFLSRWQAVDPNAGTCVSCHAGHLTDGAANAAFTNTSRTDAVCNACHAVLRGG